MFIKCLKLCPSAYPNGITWINEIISKSPHKISIIISVLGSYEPIEDRLVSLPFKSSMKRKSSYETIVAGSLILGRLVILQN